MVSYGSDLPAVFPDWSPYPDLGSAARAYLRDPDVALDALATMLGSAEVLGFTLERFVNEVNGVWQEVVVCDGRRLILWHGEGVARGGGGGVSEAGGGGARGGGGGGGGPPLAGGPPRRAGGGGGGATPPQR